MAKSRALGRSTSADVEVLGLTPHALWLIVRGKEYMLDYERFPWFRQASIESVSDVQLRHEHLHWPSLDVDLEVECLLHPERYPLVARAVRARAAGGARGLQRPRPRQTQR